MTNDDTPAAPEPDETVDLGAGRDDTIIVAGPTTADDDVHGSPPSGPETTGPPPPRRLYRSDDRMIGGVAAGVAEYFNIDPVIVRLAFVLAVFAGGAGVVAYLIGWVVIPARDGSPPGHAGRPVDPSMVAAVALLVAAIAIGFTDPFESSFWLPFLLVAGGVYLLLQRPSNGQRDDRPSSRATTLAGDRPAPTSVAATASSSAATPLPPPPTTNATPRSPAPRRPAVLTRLALSGIALVVAFGLLADDAGWFDVTVTTILGMALLVVGAAAVASSVYGKGRGLLALGLLLSLAVGVSAVAEPLVEDGIGERRVAPSSLDELEPVYRYGIGDFEVDLTAIEIPDGESHRVRVELGIGELSVRVPSDIDLDLSGDVGAGELRLLDVVQDGIRNDLRATRDVAGDGLLIVELDLGFGEGSVTSD